MCYLLGSGMAAVITYKCLALLLEGAKSHFLIYKCFCLLDYGYIEELHFYLLLLELNLKENNLTKKITKFEFEGQNIFR